MVTAITNKEADLMTNQAENEHGVDKDDQIEKLDDNLDNNTPAMTSGIGE